ncbi:uncharacterized protein LOC142334667 isoform X2 [Convolutriloba macropyga]|uniref:uncharacterized protein LOC142334667 isoform X2 n=1 Tax=Convolutriloba macropyga TaxID=536237 RepID=UPI003F51CD11
MKNMCKSILLERAVDYIKELQSQLPDFRTAEASEAPLYKEIINLRIMNEELKRQLTQVLNRNEQPPPMCAACATQLLCLKCSGLLGQCLVAPTYSPTDIKEESQTTDVAGMKTLPIVASTDISPTVMISTSSLGAVLSPTPSRILSTGSPTMVHVDESTISFSNGIGSVIDLNCSIPECALSDASNEVEMINRNASVPDINS